MIELLKWMKQRGIMNNKCPVRKECQCGFVCTYNTEKGTEFNFTPRCFVEPKVDPIEAIKKRTEEFKKAKTVKRINPVNNPPIVPVTYSLVTFYPPLPKKPNIWDDI